MSVVRECTKPGLIMARAKGVSADRLAVALKVERDTLEVEDDEGLPTVCPTCLASVYSRVPLVPDLQEALAFTKAPRTTAVEDLSFSLERLVAPSTACHSLRSSHDLR